MTTWSIGPTDTDYSDTPIFAELMRAAQRTVETVTEAPRRGWLRRFWDFLREN